jgi:hypothetical protein
VAAVDITSKQVTWFKKEPVAADTLPNDKKARVVKGRTYRGCTPVGHRDGHTHLDMGVLGDWWVFDEHWLGLVPAKKPYAEDGNLRYLKNFPYFWQQDNGSEGWRQCQSSSIAMCLKYLNVPGINDDIDYLHYVNKYGDTTTRAAHYRALSELKVPAAFKMDLDEIDIKAQIDLGKPVPVGILHHGTVDSPRGGGHFIVITGYSGDDFWLVQDPFGELDLVNGYWLEQTPTAGKNQHYSFRNLKSRLFVGGGASGWGWTFQ